MTRPPLTLLLLCAACGPTQPTLTLLQLGTAGEDQGVAIGLDRHGAVYVAANTLGAWAEGPDVAGPQDGVLLQLAPDGSQRWARQYGSAGADTVHDLVVSPDGEAYLVGAAGDAVPGAQTLGELDAFAVAFDAEGSRRWAAQWGSPVGDTALAAVLRPEGLLVAGYEGTIDRGLEMFVRPFAADGTAEQAWTFGSAEDHDFGNALAWDPQRRAVYVVGGSLGTVDGPGNPGSTDAVIVRRSPLDTPHWARQLGTRDIDGAVAVQLAPDGGAFVIAVSFSNLETGEFENDGRQSSWLLRYTAEGERRWIRRLTASTHAARANALGVTADGSAIVGGFTHGAREGFSNAGGADAFLLKLDPDGETVWELQWGTAESEEIAGLTLAPAGDLLVVGSTFGALVADGALGDRDVFVARIQSDGTPTW